MKLFHQFVTGLLILVSRLPFPVLYFLSGILAFKLNYIFRYRKKIVGRNLQNAFPDKKPAELKRIRNLFYRNLTDLILEIIKTQNISGDELKKRIKFRNYELLNDLYRKGKSVIVTIGHCGNWEWMTQVLDMQGPFTAFAVVKPLSNPFFEGLLKRLRTKFTAEGGLIPFKNALREMVRRKTQQTITIFAGDQTPTKGEINYWTTFLNQDTPVFLGIEKIAKALDMPVVYFNIQREKRGFYVVDISLIEEFPKSTRDHEITEKHVKKLESAIQQHPENWLWSHRRWKHSRE
jgi:Kdo2-lipid IVA lauroyltransferase/acyltransferase